MGERGAPHSTRISWDSLLPAPFIPASPPCSRLSLSSPQGSRNPRSPEHRECWKLLWLRPFPPLPDFFGKPDAGFPFHPRFPRTGPFLGSFNSFVSSFPWESEPPQLTETREVSAAGNAGSGNIPRLPPKTSSRGEAGREIGIRFPPVPEPGFVREEAMISRDDPGLGGIYGALKPSSSFLILSWDIFPAEKLWDFSFLPAQIP